MTAPEDLEQMRKEFEQQALLGPSLGASYGLLLIQRLTEAEQREKDLRERLKELTVQLLAIGGMYWNGLPQLPSAVSAEP